MAWYIPEERCENCKWYSEEDNGLCGFYAKFKDKDTEACEHYKEEK